MTKEHVLELLNQVKDGKLSPEEAVLKLKLSPFQDIGYAKIDRHRELRQGAPEIIFGQGKTPEQIAGIVRTMTEQDGQNVLITRLSAEAAELLQGIPLFEYAPLPHVGMVKLKPPCGKGGKIVVATGGTSDMAVAEEAALTAEFLGNEVVRLYDVGVAGLHRLLGHLDLIMQASVIVAIAGMEGALASVIGGLADCPVIAVPTSVGYGANFGGLSALLSMLNSCASGVSVVNIDNGFGAGYQASMINQMNC